MIIFDGAVLLRYTWKVRRADECSTGSVSRLILGKFHARELHVYLALLSCEVHPGYAHLSADVLNSQIDLTRVGCILPLAEKTYTST